MEETQKVGDKNKPTKLLLTIVVVVILLLGGAGLVLSKQLSTAKKTMHQTAKQTAE